MTKVINYPFAFFEGEIKPFELARVNIMTNALQYGTAVFGGIRGYLAQDSKNINIFRLTDHYQRFLNSLKIINKSIRYDKRKLMEITLELARKNKPETDCYFRPFAYASCLDFSPDLTEVNFDFAMYAVKLGEYLPINKGLKLVVSSWTRLSDNVLPPRAKITGGYINSSMARTDAVRVGCDDALMMTSDGHIAEGSAANFFLVRDGQLITPPSYGDILEGITRRSIITVAGDLGIPVVERPIDKTEVYVADEAFLAGTGVQVAWISEVDGRVIGEGKIGPISAKIQKLFFNIVRGREKKYASWLTKV